MTSLKVKPLLLAAGTKRFNPENMKVNIDRLEYIFKRRIDVVMPAKSIRMTTDGKMYFDIPQKLFSVGGTTFTDFKDAETESDKLRDEGEVDDYKVHIISGSERQLSLTRTAKQQLLERVDIPVRVANRQAAENRGDLVWRFVGDAIARSNQSVLVRVLDNEVRSVLSSKYRAIDSLELLKQTTNSIKAAGADILEIRVWEDKFQLTAVNPNLKYTIQELLGDNPRYGGISLPDNAVSAMLEIDNDEAGGGGLNLLLGMYTYLCTNYMLMRRPVLSIKHSGSNLVGSALESLVLSPNTRLLQARADISKMNDAVSSAFSAERFNKMMEAARAAANDVIPDDKKSEAVKAAMYTSKIPKSEFDAIYESLIADRDLSRYGLIQAVTRIPDSGRAANVADLCDRAGGDLLQLQTADWERWIDVNAKSYDNGAETEEAVLL